MKFTINLLIFCAWFLSPQFALAEASLNFLYTPGSTVFTRMDSADAYSAINFHNGIEDIYFRVGAPKGIASGGVLTITPVPAAPESVAIEDARLDWNMFLTKEDMYVNLEEYIDSSKLLLRAFRMVPELIPVSIVLLSIFFLSIFSCCCLVMIAMKLVKRQTNEYVKKILGASAFLTCTLLLVSC